MKTSGVRKITAYACPVLRRKRGGGELILNQCSAQHITAAKRIGVVTPRPAAHWLPRVRSSQRRLAAER